MRRESERGSLKDETWGDSNDIRPADRSPISELRVNYEFKLHSSFVTNNSHPDWYNKLDSSHEQKAVFYEVICKIGL